MATLITLPVEMLHHIFCLLEPEDLGSLPRVCSTLHEYVGGNMKLHKDVYLNHFDKPFNEKMDWIRELQDITKLQLICKRKTVEEKEPELEFVSDVVDRFLTNASSKGYTTDNSRTHCASRNADLLKKLFNSQSTTAAFLERSFLFERVKHDVNAKFPETTVSTHQQSAKLHCLYGKPILNIGRLRSTRTYPFACSKVYDLRQHTAQSRWGPFMGDGSGRVDWEKMEAIMLTLGHNIHSKRFVTQLFSDVWDSPFSGSWPRSLAPSLPLEHEQASLEAQDPYGVTGTWYRIVCFLDFSDFTGFNSPHRRIPDDSPRPPIEVGEATRLIVLQVHVTKIDPPGPDDGQDLPVVHFVGISRTVDDELLEETGYNGLRGTVRQTKEGEIHWTTISIFHGEERWRSESIQVGGLRSARGVIGTWFDKDYAVHGPAGPTAFWKASDLENVSSRLEDILPSGFLAYTALLEMDPDPEGELDYTTGEDEILDEEEDILEIELINEELPALLLDAELELFAASISQEDHD